MLLLILRYFIFHMIKRFLTFALSVGFFIWLPNAFADGNGILSLDAPSHIRQTQNNHKDLLTLRVDNIQVRAGWEVTDADSVFTIKADGNVGVLQTVKTIVAPVIHVATIYVEDKFELLNPSYANLTASAVITVKFKSGTADKLGLDDAPLLIAVAGEAATLHTFAAEGGSGDKTYTLVGGDDADYFGLDKDSGVLSLLASAQAGVYTLTVEVADADGASGTVEALATVEVSAALMLSDAPLISVALGTPVSLYTFIASGGIGRKTYTLAAGDESYFSVDAGSGVLSLLAGAQAGVHTLTVQAIDGRNVTVDALATVRVSAALMLLDAPSFTVIASVGMSLHTFIASGGIGIKTYALLASDESYFSVNAGSGVLSLQAGAEPGAYVLKVLATDEHDNTAEALATVEVSAALSLADASSLGGAAGTAMSLHTFVAEGGIGARTYTLMTDDVEDYFSLGAESGVLSLLANASVAIYTLSVQVRDGEDNMAYALATVEVRELFLANAGLLYAIEGRAVSLHTFAAQGATGAGATYTLVAGDEGYFTLGTNSGVLSVKATIPIGIYTLSVQVGNAAGNQADAMAIVEVRASLSLATVPPLTVIVGRVAHTLAASSGIGIYTYTILSGDEGVFALDAASGVLSLWADAALGRHTLTVQVADARNNTVQAVATVEVSAALALSDAPSFTVIASVAMSLHMFIASGGIGTPTYAIVSGDESYFSVNASSGVLSLAADAEPDTYVLRIQITDARDNTDEAVATVGVSAALSLADAPRLTAVAGEAVSLHTFSAKGGIGAKTYTLVEGDDADYFDLDKNSGVLSLQASAQAGVYTLTVQVADDASGPVGALATVEVSAALMLADAPLISVALGAAVSLHKFIASGGIGRKTYTLAAGNKDYFSVDAGSGVLSLLTTAQEGVHMITVQASDEGNRKVEALATVMVLAALMLADAPLFTVIASAAMSLHTFIASGGIGTPTYTILAGNEKEGFTLNAASGVLSLQADAEPDTYVLRIQATDAHHNTAQALATVGVSAVLALADAPLLRTIEGGGGNLHTFAATGGIGDKTYTLVAGNEDYFSLDRSSGVLAMNADATLAMYTLSVQVADAEGNVASALATVKVGSLLLRDVMLYAIVGREVSLYTFEADGGSGAKVFTIVAGNEDKYFTLDGGSGVLSVQGSVTVGIYTLAVAVDDEDGNRSEALAVVAVESSLFLADTPLLTAVAEMTMSVHTFAASGGIGAKTYTLSADNGSGYFAINATSGVLSVVNATVGVYTLSVTVSDSRGNQVEARGTVEVVGVLSLADAPPLEALARLSVPVALHTFVASGGDEAKRYTLIADEAGYFAIDAASGELSLPKNSAMLAGDYTLRVGVLDGLTPPQRATAVATVRIIKNGIFVISGHVVNFGYHRNDVWRSVDGEAWKEEPRFHTWPGRDDYQAVVYQGQLYVLGGQSHFGRLRDVHRSADGKTWVFEGNAAWPERARHQAVAYQGRLYVLGGAVQSLGGHANDVWSWAKGQSWRKDKANNTSGWTKRQGHQAVVHNGRLYVLGGQDSSGYVNDVWSSADGVNWRFEGNAEWPGRWLYEAVSHQGRLYIMGGDDGSTKRNDVWSSLDGKSWRQELANDNDFWSKRNRFGALSHDGLLYVLGGNDGNRQKDVWSSADGRSWTKGPNAAWRAREGLQALVFPSPLVLSGTSETITLPLQAAAMALHTVSAQYGGGQYFYSLTPEIEDFNIDGAGVLSTDGDAQAGVYTLTVRVKDEEGSHAETIINIEIRSIALADAPPLFVFAGLAESVSLHAFTAVYGVGESTYELVGDASGYFTLGTASGVLSVTANVSVGVYTVSVKVSDERAKTATAVATVAAVPILSLADAPLMSVIVGRAVSLHTFTAVGGSRIKTYNLVDAPGFFALGESSGILSVQAVSEVGIYTVSVRVSDESGQAAAVAIVAVAASLSLADASLMAVEKKAVSLHTFAASGGIGARTYTLLAGNETGYFILESGGVLSLSASASPGTYALTVGVMDERGNAATAVAAVNIAVALSLADAPPLVVAEGYARDLHTFVASGGFGVKTYTLVAGAAYFTVGAASGVLSVNANAPVAIYTLSVQAADADGVTAVALATVEVVSLLLLDAPMLYAIAGREVSLYTFEADGGSGAKVFTIVDGNESMYFTLVASSGVLSVQAKASVGIYTLSVAVDDEDGNQSEGLAVVAVEASLFLADTPSLVAFTEITMSLYTFAASGGIGAKTYTLSAVEGQEYFTLNATSGVLSAANAALGVYTLSVTVSDSRGNSAQARGTVQVFEFLSLADAPSLEVLARLSVTVTLHTFAAGGGYGAKRYTLIADETSYFALDAVSGELSLPSNSAMLAGTYTLRVGVSDSLSSPQRATAAATVQIARNRIFVLGGASNGLRNDVWSSADGESWRQDKANNNNVGWTQRQLHQAVAHNGRLYVMGGADGGKRKDVWWSVDGANWQQEADAAWTGREIHQAVSYKGRIYVLGGQVSGGSKRNDVWSSADGVTWRRDKANNTTGWTARDRHQAVVHNGRMYVLGGQVSDGGGGRNDVWSSANGSSWRFEGNADWDARYFHQAVSHAGRLYVLGGSDGNVKSDVWSSVDGRSWVREKANTGVSDPGFSWSQRYRHQSLSRDGLLYVLGGQDSGGKKDVWSSADGKSWEQKTDAAWSARLFHQALVFPSNLVLSGTSETITLTLQTAAVALHTLSAQYGGGQYAYSLPPEIEGFRIDGAGVLLADGDAQGGAYALTVRVEDEEGSHAESIVNIDLRVLSLADAPPLFVIAGLSESVSLHAFTVSHGVGTYIYDLVGDESGYFTLDAANGVLSVTANVAVGVYTVSVEVSDDSGNQATAVATVEALPMLSLADAPLLSVVAGKALELHTFIAVGGIKAKTYNLVDAAGYFTLGASSGILSAQAASEVGIYTVSVEVSDSVGNQATAQATVGVTARLSLADASLLAVEKKAVSLHTFVASGGIGARTYTLSVGNETGYFVLDAASGVLSLSANASAGEYTLTVGVKDERSNIAAAVATVNISAALSLAGVSQLLVVAEGAAKNLHTFVASGGLGVKTYTLAAGAGYFTIGAASGVLSVDANATVGMYTLSVQAADADGNVVEALATAQVVSLLLADVMLYAIVGRGVSLHTFEADGKGGAKTYTIVAGDDDKYFRLDANSGVLSVRGSVTVGIYTLSVEVRDAEDNRAEALAVVAVEASLFLADAPPLTVMAGLALSLHTFAASDGIGVKAYTITAGNEAGYFTLNAASGVLSLRATAPEGFHTLTVQAADEYNNLAEAVATVDVSAALSLAEVPLLEAVVGMTMSVHTFAASGGIGAKTYTLVVDNGAGYFAMNATSGVLSVANATVGVYILSVKVSDSRDNQVEARATVQVLPPMSLADAPLLEALARLSVTVALHTFVASDGIGSKRYTIIADEAGYFALDAGSGELSLPSNSAMRAGAYTLRVEVSDSLSSPQRATAAATVQIARNGIFVLGGNESGSAVNDMQNDVWSSMDGGSWREDTSSANWTARELHQVVAHRGRMYLLGGVVATGQTSTENRNDVWSSLDGKNWSLVTGSAGWTARGGHQALVHNGRMYVLGGRDANGHRNDVWSSADGVTWRKDKANNSVDWVLALYQAVAHNGRMYVLGGYNKSDVWSSADGSSWRFEGNAAWGLRHLHQAVSHAGRLYVLGGIERVDNSDNRRNDVWSSLDGRIWEQEKASNNAFWAGRDRYQALSRDGLLYVLGGNAGSLRKDVWSSPDGKSWSVETSAAGWGAREYHQAVVFPPNLVLSGTSETITLTVGVAAELHPFSAQYGFGQYTYLLPTEIEGFEIDESSGVLSADNQVQAGVYEITVRVEDEEGGHAESIINIELRVLALADAPPLSVIAGAEAMSLHVFTAIYGIGTYTYNLVDESGYFTLGDASGVLSVTANVAVGVYTLSVEVSDDSGKMATAVATVEAVPMLSLADAPPLTVTAGLTVSVHTFAASGGIGAKTYTLSADNGAEYFAINATSGVLSVVNAAVGDYTLTVQVEDERGSQAETVVQVEIVAASTAALSAGSSIISPPASGGGASALALAGGGLSLLIITPPASSLARPRTPPTSAGGENIGGATS